MMAIPLTLIDEGTMGALKDLFLKKGYPPTIRDVQEHMGLSNVSVALYRLNRLRRRGLIDWEENKARTMRILPDEREVRHG